MERPNPVEAIETNLRGQAGALYAGFLWCVGSCTVVLVGAALAGGWKQVLIAIGSWGVSMFGPYMLGYAAGSMAAQDRILASLHEVGTYVARKMQIEMREAQYVEADQPGDGVRAPDGDRVHERNG